MSLLSLSTGDYGCIVPLMQQLMARFATDHVAVSLPSLRAGTLTPELMELIKKVRKTGFTIAPEAGSQRLRDVINKNITESEIVETVTDAFRLGWRVIKLYFMIGLPTETHADLHALVDLVKRLRRIKVPHRKPGKINVSVATFIPKPHTPFQWAPQNTLAESQAKISWLKKQLALPGIQFKWQNPEVSLIEGLWSRGDRSLSDLLVLAHHKGCKFDGWSDKFRFDLWQQAFSETGIDTDFFTVRQRDVCEPLPWDHIDTRVSKAFLQDEWNNAIRAAFTDDCRDGDCGACGVCDFVEIEPKAHKDCRYSAEGLASTPAPADTEYMKISLSYSKLEQAKYIGHLELMNIFMRALRRAGIPLKFSEGFHPKPKVSFKDSLPIGLESQCEQITLTVPVGSSTPDIIGCLNANLPPGLRMHDLESAPASLRAKGPPSSTYQVRLQSGNFSEVELANFNAKTRFTSERQDRKGKLKKIDLKAMVFSIELIDSKQLQMTLSSEPGKTLRPGDALRQIFSVSEEQIKRARILKVN
jgi:radical SAM-linked protein